MRTSNRSAQQPGVLNLLIRWGFVHRRGTGGSRCAAQGRQTEGLRVKKMDTNPSLPKLLRSATEMQSRKEFSESFRACATSTICWAIPACAGTFYGSIDDGSCGSHVICDSRTLGVSRAVRRRPQRRCSKGRGSAEDYPETSQWRGSQFSRSQTTQFLAHHQSSDSI